MSNQQHWKYVTRNLTEKEVSKLKQNRVKKAERALAAAKKWEPDMEILCTLRAEEPTPACATSVREATVLEDYMINSADYVSNMMCQMHQVNLKVMRASGMIK